MENGVADVRAAGNRGIAQMQQGRRDRAAVEFEAALDAAETITDDRTRRDEISVLATMFASFGLNDLALVAAEEAVELDRSLKLDSQLPGDLLAVGNAHAQLENAGKAEAAYNEALSIAITSKQWADAASATTNLAGTAANSGQLDQAATLLQTSLDYLKREPFDETEINTRLTLLQVLELGGGDLELALNNAEILCNTYWQRVSPDARPMVTDFVGRMLQRYAEAHAEARDPAWVQRRFPTLGT